MRKSFRSVALFLTLACVLTAGTAGAAEVDRTGWPGQLRFMAGPPGGNWLALGMALSEMWTGAGLPQTTSGSGGGVSNILNAHTRRGDLGFSVTSLLGAAVKGEADFEGHAVSNAVLMANLYTQYTYFIMRKDFAVKNGVRSVDDIVARKLPMRFATLKPGTSSEFVIRALFAKGFGFDYKKTFTEWGGSVEYASYEGGADLLSDNHLDCFAFSVGKIAPVVMNIESQLDVVLLPVGQDALDRLSDAYGTTTFTIDPGIYRSVPEGAEPVKVVGDYTCLVVRRDLPDFLVYELNKAIWEHRDGLIAAVKDVRELAPAMAISGKVPTHPGSLSYWSGVR
ncbi:MAG: TAXI family TRAP transporter solute-binding subunit [Fretibacterium sp.]|nr:TAXI family TRAP transporter solute-binding subunit [Fretibacterium sp.]